jgi:AraC family transcriptional regulator, transcriptional activator of pobA
VARVIPNYSLYGDQALPGWQSFFDFEWIPQRSRPYNWEIRPHTHDAFIQILFLSQGSVEVLLDQARIEANAPCVILVPAQTVHGFHFSQDVDGPVVTAAQRPLESLAGVLMPELLQTIRKPGVITLPDREREIDELMHLFLAVEREGRHHAIGHVAAGMSLLIALLVQIARLQQTQLTAPLQVASRKTAKIEKFRALVDEHFKEHLPMQAYASQLGITPGQLTRLCREALGMSSLEVIHSRLIHEAQRDLVYTANSVRQLADGLGFTDEAYFGRFFRKQTGLTPREFRARALDAMLKVDAQPAAH